MDRKALIAIVLSTILIIAYQVLFLKPPEGPPPGADSAAGVAETAIGPGGETAPAAEAGAETAAASDSPAQPVAGIEEEEGPGRIVPVLTPLFEIDLDSRGAAVRAIRLRRFEGLGGNAVALLDSSAPPALGLVVETRGGEVDLRRSIFSVDRDEVRLGPGDEETAVVFEKTHPSGISVRRVYRFRADSYRVDVEQTIAAAEPAPRLYSYRLLWEPGIAFTEESRVEETREMAAVTALATKTVRDQAGKVKEGETTLRTGGVRFAALKNKYFAIALMTGEEKGPDVRIRRIPGEDRVSLDLEIASSDAAHDEARIGLFAGPLEMSVLRKEGVGLDGMVDLGWSWIRPISQLTLSAMKFLYRWVPNYGVVIFLVSLITKLLFYRLTSKSLKSMKDMQRIQVQVTALREKYKSDAQRLNKETMALYKREGVNPLSGCLPMLLQMPVFIALYQVLQRTIALRKAPFVLWIDDLSRPDVLATLPISLPFLGAHLSLLPLLMGVSMIFQQKMTTVDPRQKAMIYLMPVLFTGLFYRLPSGLVLYWLVNNVLSIGQQYLLNRGEAKGGGRGGAPASGGEEGTNNNTIGKKATGRGREGAPRTKESK